MEFPLSPAAACGDSSAAAGQENNTAPQKGSQLRAARLGGPRNGRSGNHHYQNQGAAANTIAATRAPVAPGEPTNPTNSKIKHRNRNNSGNAGAGSPPAEPNNRYGGWWGEGDEVLRTMGGGYLTVASLSTLSRAISSPATRAAAGTPSTPHGAGIFTNHHHKSPHHHNNDVKDVFGQYEVSQEVSDLLLLLASLFRLGSPPSQVCSRRRCLFSLSFVDLSFAPRPANPSGFSCCSPSPPWDFCADAVDPPSQKVLLLFSLDAAATWVVFAWLRYSVIPFFSPAVSHIA